MDNPYRSPESVDHVPAAAQPVSSAAVPRAADENRIVLIPHKGTKKDERWTLTIEGKQCVLRDSKGAERGKFPHADAHKQITFPGFFVWGGGVLGIRPRPRTLGNWFDHNLFHFKPDEPTVQSLQRLVVRGIRAGGIQEVRRLATSGQIATVLGGGGTFAIVVIWILTLIEFLERGRTTMGVIPGGLALVLATHTLTLGLRRRKLALWAAQPDQAPSERG